jgi:hypothetical protein
MFFIKTPKCEAISQVPKNNYYCMRGENTKSMIDIKEIFAGNLRKIRR